MSEVPPGTRVSPSGASNSTIPTSTDVGPPFTEDPAELLHRVQAGDPVAFAQLYDAHAQIVYRVCWRRGSGTDPADLMSIVFLDGCGKPGPRFS